MSEIKDFMLRLNKEIKAVKIKPNDGSKRNIGDNDTLIDELPLDLCKLYVLKERDIEAYKVVTLKRENILFEGLKDANNAPKLIVEFSQLNKLFCRLKSRTEMLNGLFDLALNDRFQDYADYHLEVCWGFKLVVCGAED